ncbi:MAG: TonB-dependent receptor [Ferruginibacter sp.]|nr:TonB-dependent receptor [Cytophagales bacterium]
MTTPLHPLPALLALFLLGASLSESASAMLPGPNPTRHPNTFATAYPGRAGRTQRFASVTGTVTDALSKEPLPGVSVRILGTTNGTTTNAEGKYNLEVAENATLVFSYIGYKTQQTAVGNRQVLDIGLEQDLQGLSEVVVIGYGTQQKRDITGSVSSLSAKNLRDIPLTNFENAIQGQIPGVQVQEPSGEPGAAPTIRVRGLGSISAGTEPLYVIDGFPVSKNVDLGVQGDVARRTLAFRPPPANPLGTLNPNDIESVEVLKDASAAAIYGSRGSNGVILITTKKGRREGKPVISLNAYYGVQTLARKVDLMNAAQLGEYVKNSKNNAYVQDVAGADINDDNPTRYTKTTATIYYLPDDFVNPTGTDTDWQDLIFGPAPLQNYNLSLAGGAERINYSVSGEYYNQNGIIDQTGFSRYSFRVNLEADPLPKLRVGLNLNPSFTSTARGAASAPYFADPPGSVYSALVHSPTVTPYNADGTINQRDNQSHLNTENGRGTSMTEASNPLAIIEGVRDDLRQFRTFGNLFAEYEILDGLTYKFFVGTDINNYNRSFYRAKSLLFRQATTGDPYGQSNASQQVNWLVENTLSYRKNFGTDHALSAVAGYTAQRDQLDLNQVLAQNYPDDLVPTVSGGQVTGGTSVREEWSLVSYLARANYTFRDKYLLTATVRADRASRFGEGNKTGLFPSVSAGWRLSEEAFLRNASFLSDLKLRASAGQTGNFFIPNYAAIGLLNPFNYVLGDVVVNGIAPSTISNQRLTWEKTTQFDVGLDVGLLQNRLYATVDWYHRRTSDLLLNVQLLASTGFVNALQNIGEVENKGLEISLSSRNLVGKFGWTTDLNFAANRNEVRKLGPSGDPILSTGGAGIRHVTRIGDPIGSYYGYVVDGIYQSQADIDAAPRDQVAPRPRPGDFRFKDVNSDGAVNANDRTVIGNYQPDFIWGLTNRFTYRGIELSFLLQGVEGAEVLNLTRRHLGNGEAATNSYADWTNRWISPEQPGNGKIPRADRTTDTHGNNNRPSSYQVEDASYLRLRTATIAYTLPSGTLGRFFRSARVYASGTNLFTLTDYLGYNPEVNNQSTLTAVQGEDYGAYPLSRNLIFGINLTF